jgi:hypothetical protein
MAGRLQWPGGAQTEQPSQISTLEINLRLYHIGAAQPSSSLCVRVRRLDDGVEQRRDSRRACAIARQAARLQDGTVTDCGLQRPRAPWRQRPRIADHHKHAVLAGSAAFPCCTGPPRIETCASAPRLCRDLGKCDAPRCARRAPRTSPRGFGPAFSFLRMKLRDRVVCEPHGTVRKASRTHDRSTTTAAPRTTTTTTRSLEEFARLPASICVLIGADLRQVESNADGPLIARCG